MTTIDNLHAQARTAIESGENKFRDAAEYLAKARQLGATQRESAKAIGKSPMWVNGLLRWRDGGYKTSCAFPNPRYSIGRVQSTVQKNKTKSRPATTAEQARAQTAKANAERAKAEAAKAKAEASKARAEENKARAEENKVWAEEKKTRSDNARARAEANDRFYEAFMGDFLDERRERKKIRSGPRELLIKALGMLGSEHAGERASAALVVEKQRAKLGMTWEELIIPAEEDDLSRAA